MSYGAIGDRLQSAESRLQSPRRSDNQQRIIRERASWDASGGSKSPLSKLVRDSLPDSDLYRLVAIGETGPLAKPISPYQMKAFDVGLDVRRRRSLSDLREQRIRLANVQSPRERRSGHDRVQQTSPAGPSPRNQGLPATIDVGVEVWQRQGPSLRQKLQVAQGYFGNIQPAVEDLDPSTFSFPIGVSLTELSPPPILIRLNSQPYFG